MQNQEDRFIRMPEVMNLTGISRTQIYSLISQGAFPKQVKLSSSSSAWSYTSVKQWMDSKIEEAGLNIQPAAA